MDRGCPITVFFCCAHLLCPQNPKMMYHKGNIYIGVYTRARVFYMLSTIPF